MSQAAMNMTPKGLSLLPQISDSKGGISHYVNSNSIPNPL